MTSSTHQVGPPHRLNLIEFAPNQIEIELDEGGGKLEPETLLWGRTRHGAKTVSFITIRTLFRFTDQQCFTT